MEITGKSPTAATTTITDSKPAEETVKKSSVTDGATKDTRTDGMGGTVKAPTETTMPKAGEAKKTPPSAEKNEKQLTAIELVDKLLTEYKKLSLLRGVESKKETAAVLETSIKVLLKTKASQLVSNYLNGDGKDQKLALQAQVLYALIGSNSSLEAAAAALAELQTLEKPSSSSGKSRASSSTPTPARPQGLNKQINEANGKLQEAYKHTEGVRTNKSIDIEGMISALTAERVALNNLLGLLEKSPTVGDKISAAHIKDAIKRNLEEHAEIDKALSTFNSLQEGLR